MAAGPEVGGGADVSSAADVVLVDRAGVRAHALAQRAASAVRRATGEVARSMGGSRSKPRSVPCAGAHAARAAVRDGRPPLVHVEVGAANVRARDADERIRRALDARLGHVLDAHVARAFVHKGLHRIASFGRRACRRKERADARGQLRPRMAQARSLRDTDEQQRRGQRARVRAEDTVSASRERRVELRERYRALSPGRSAGVARSSPRRATLASVSLLRLERIVFVVLVGLAVLPAVVLPVLPGHDLPQHLAYVSLIVSWGKPALRLATTYLEPTTADPYATTYVVLAAIARKSSVELAARIAFVAYAVALPCAVAHLARAVWRRRRDETCPTALLGPALVWNPVVCMGFLPFFLALPPLVSALACAVRFADEGRRRHLALFAVFASASAAMHAVACYALCLVLVVFTAWRRDARSPAVLAVSAAVVAALTAWTPRAGKPMGEVARELVANVRAYGLVPGTVGTFRLSFTDAVEKGEMIVANVVGTFPRREKILVAAVLGLVVATVGVTAYGRSAHARALPVRGARPAIVGLAVVAVLAPDAIQVPDDMSLFDFRMLTLATILGVAVVPPHLAFARPARLAIVVFATVYGLLWFRQLHGLAGEMAAVVRLVDRLSPNHRLLAVPLRDRSAYLDERNAVMHYVPVFHTVRNAGMTSLFWGKFIPRLPVGYRPGAEPAHPADWAPWELVEGHLDGFTHVLVPRPSDDDDDPGLRDAYATVARLLRDGRLTSLACDGDWCLYRVAAP